MVNRSPFKCMFIISVGEYICTAVSYEALRSAILILYHIHTADRLKHLLWRPSRSPGYKHRRLLYRDGTPAHTAHHVHGHHLTHNTAFHHHTTTDGARGRGDLFHGKFKETNDLGTIICLTKLDEGQIFHCFARSHRLFFLPDLHAWHICM